MQEVLLYKTKNCGSRKTAAADFLQSKMFISP